MAELNLHSRPCLRYSLFLCWKGTSVSQPTINYTVFTHDSESAGGL